MPTILITNDDGISSPGIKALYSALKPLGEICVVAPESEQSAVAHALTLHRPLRCHKHSENAYCVNGTPTDCVIVAVNKLLSHKPDLIVSGINDGGNLGDNLTYSGTVAAAMEGTLLGIPSIALSLVREDINEIHTGISQFKRAARHARALTKKILGTGIPGDTLLNINIPDISRVKGIKITRQGKLSYDNAINDLKDPRGRKVYWIGGGSPQWEKDASTDIDAVHNGYISITPVHLDLTNYEAMDILRKLWR